MKRSDGQKDVEFVCRCVVCGNRIILQDTDIVDGNIYQDDVHECCGNYLITSTENGMFVTDDTIDVFEINYGSMVMRKPGIRFRKLDKWYRIASPTHTGGGRRITNNDDYKEVHKKYRIDYRCSNSDLLEESLGIVETGPGPGGTFILPIRHDHPNMQFGPRGCKSLMCIFGVSWDNEIPFFEDYKGNEYTALYSKEIDKNQKYTIYEAKVLKFSRTILEITSRDIFVAKVKFAADKGKEKYIVGNNRKEVLDLAEKKLTPPKKVKKRPIGAKGAKGGKGLVATPLQMPNLTGDMLAMNKEAHQSIFSGNYKAESKAFDIEQTRKFMKDELLQKRKKSWKSKIAKWMMGK